MNDNPFETEVTISVCDEILKTMKRYEFTEEEITNFSTSALFIDSATKSPMMQKAMISLLFFRVITYAEVSPPQVVRLALAASDNLLEWLDNVKLIILPYIQSTALLKAPYYAG